MNAVSPAKMSRGCAHHASRRMVWPNARCCNATSVSAMIPAPLPSKASGLAQFIAGADAGYKRICAVEVRRCRTSVLSPAWPAPAAGYSWQEKVEIQADSTFMGAIRVIREKHERTFKMRQLTLAV